MSWNELLSIQKERRAVKRTMAAQDPVACPRDGTPLLREPVVQGGLLRCRFCGWRHTGVTNPMVAGFPEEEPLRSGW